MSYANPSKLNNDQKSLMTFYFLTSIDLAYLPCIFPTNLARCNVIVNSKKPAIEIKGNIHIGKYGDTITSVPMFLFLLHYIKNRAVPFAVLPIHIYLLLLIIKRCKGLIVALVFFAKVLDAFF